MAVDLRLLEEREGNAEFALAELLDFLGVAGLLPTELIAGEAEDEEATGCEFVEKSLQIVG